MTAPCTHEKHGCGYVKKIRIQERLNTVNQMNIITDKAPELKHKTACFTGGRPKTLFPTHAYAQSREVDYTRMVVKVSELVENLYQQEGITRFITGGAQGFDQIAFQAVAFVKKRHPEIENIVYIPFKGQETRWSETGRFGQQKYREMLEQADAVYNCAGWEFDNTSADFRTIAKMLFKRNEDMCSDSDTCIGQFPNDDWQSKSTKGGTAGCLRYAQNQGLRLIVRDFRP